MNEEIKEPVKEEETPAEETPSETKPKEESEGEPKEEKQPSGFYGGHEMDK